jgi:putative transcriptional regulator
VSTTGRLLVATPLIGDPNFERAVVLVLEHNDDGALGLVINRPTDTEVAAAVPGWDLLAPPPPVVFVGGPVSPESAVCLGRVGPGPPADEEAWKPLFDRLATVDASRPAADVDGVETVRLFAGYAGWGAGQLETEIEAGAWFVVDRQPGDEFTDEPEGLWRAVLRRQPGELALFATFPDDPRAN